MATPVQPPSQGSGSDPQQNVNGPYNIMSPSDRYTTPPQSREAQNRPHRTSDPSTRTLANRSSQVSVGSGASLSSGRAHSPVHGPVHTLPPWIESYELGEQEDDMRIQPHPLHTPQRSRAPQHNHTPTQPSRRLSKDGYISDEDLSSSALEKAPEKGIFGTQAKPPPGRRWDHIREDESIFMSNDWRNSSLKAVRLMKASQYGPSPGEDTQRVDYDYLDQLNPGYNQPWRGDLEKDGENSRGLLNGKRRKAWYDKVQHVLLMHPLVPLAFRMTTLTTSLIAIGISSSAYPYTKGTGFSPSTIMAIIVDVLALPYICYITWDEYTGKPLGLRSPKAKIRLLLLDLFFIIFESANLAIAFSSISDDNESCNIGNSGNIGICGRLKALAAILLIALVAWTLTFITSIFRLVERVGGREEGEP